jgi:hypothetical protein
MILTELI